MKSVRMASVAIAAGIALAFSGPAPADEKTTAAAQATITVDGEVYRFSGGCWIDGDPPRTLEAEGPGEGPGGKPVHFVMLAMTSAFGSYSIYAGNAAEAGIDDRIAAGGLSPDKLELTPTSLRASVVATTFAGKKRLKKSVPAEVEITGCGNG